MHSIKKRKWINHFGIVVLLRHMFKQEPTTGLISQKSWSDDTDIRACSNKKIRCMCISYNSNNPINVTKNTPPNSWTFLKNCTIHVTKGKKKSR